MVRSGRDVLEVVAAVLLGLVSVLTTFGAYQAASWSGQADELAGVSQQLRDRTLTGVITSQLQSRDDGAKLLEVVALDAELSIDPAREAEILREQGVIIASISPELMGPWEAWEACGRCLELVPIAAIEYEVALFGEPMSMQIAGYVADREAAAMTARAGTITVAAVVFAIALFLLGVSATSVPLRVMIVLVIGGGVAFVVGTVLTLLAAL